MTIAQEGAEALARLEAETFDLVLMDLQMPGMSGLEATAAIRQRERATGAHIRIVAMTARAMASDREQCLAAGMDGYLSKPIDRTLLIEAVEAGGDGQTEDVPVGSSRVQLRPGREPGAEPGAGASSTPPDPRRDAQVGAARADGEEVHPRRRRRAAFHHPHRITRQRQDAERAKIGPIRAAGQAVLLPSQLALGAERREPSGVAAREAGHHDANCAGRIGVYVHVDRCRHAGHPA